VVESGWGNTPRNSGGGGGRGVVADERAGAADGGEVDVEVFKVVLYAIGRLVGLESGSFTLP
jgi:hypothetical protein